MEADYNEFRTRLSSEINAALGRGSGTQWGAVQSLLAEWFEMDAAQIGAISVSTNGVIGNRLCTPGIIRKSPDVFLVVSLEEDYGPEDLIARTVELTGKTRHLTTVLAAHRETDSDEWDITHAVVVEGLNRLEELLPQLPHLSRIERVPLTPLSPLATVQRYEPAALEARAQATPTSLDSLASLPDGLLTLAASRSLRLDRATATDVLACALASQFVLFAGPSGTGKSTVARLLADFLSAPDSIAVIESRAGWSGPEDVFGYYSALTERFAHTPNTEVIVNLSDSVARELSEEGPGLDLAAASVLLVEEANLSPIESYLAPISHGLSAVSVPLVRWQLHAQSAGAMNAEALHGVPATAVLGPWPRVFGTINVDANSIAPARKVTARAAVVLLEPSSWDPDVDAVRLAGQVSEDAPAELAPATDAASAPIRAMGNPAGARLSLNDAGLAPLLQEFARLLDVMSGSTPLVASHRDIERAANYMAYFQALAGGGSAAVRVAAENAVIHVVLPQLAPRAFVDAVRGLVNETTLADDTVELGGLLGRRVQALDAATRGALFRDSIDFWNALS